MSKEKKNPTVNAAVIAFGRANGYDGLYDPDGECACEWDDLQPCGEDYSGCIYGYKVKDESGEYDWLIVKDKAPKTEGE